MVYWPRGMAALKSVFPDVCAESRKRGMRRTKGESAAEKKFGFRVSAYFAYIIERNLSPCRMRDLTPHSARKPHSAEDLRKR